MITPHSTTAEDLCVLPYQIEKINYRSLIKKYQTISN